MCDKAIGVENLTATYPGGQRPAVADMTFAVRRAEVFGFLGPSGAGKSTVHRILTRRLRRYTGSVTILGRPLDSWRQRELFERVGVGFELPARFPRLTARENLAAFAAFYRGPTDDPESLLELLDLAAVADRPVSEFSKGMLVRLNLARALINRPRVLLVDEPTSGLDPVRAESVRDVLRRRADAGTTVFLTTHDMVTASRICDRVAFVADGKIAAVDDPRSLELAYGQPEVVLRFRTETGTGHRRIPLSDFDAMTPGRVETVHSREAGLDEVFAAVVHRATGAHDPADPR